MHHLTLEREINKKQPANKTPCNVACLQEKYKKADQTNETFKNTTP